MQKLEQNIRHDPANGKYGNCLQTCFAIILDEDIECIPHFCDDPERDHKDRIRKFLAGRDMNIFTVMFPGSVSFDDLLLTTGHYNPDVAVIISGKSPRGFNHCVVAMNGKIFCDPFDGTANQEPFTGPSENTDTGDIFWWVEVITVANP